MTTLRRFLVLQILMLWQGGFLFYAAFVVPAGTEALGSAESQGAITTRVTDSLNLLAVAGLALLVWELLAARDQSRRRTAIRWSCWTLAAACQVVLFVVHQQLEAMMDPARTFVIERASFYSLHRVYLWTSMVQWLACLVLAWLTLRSWTSKPP